MSNEIQKHEELKQCAIHAYGKNKNLPVNYKLTNTFINNHNGFSASILKKDNEIIISYCGSNSFVDYVGSDRDMWLKKLPAQVNDALHVYNKIKQQYPQSNRYLLFALY